MCTAGVGRGAAGAAMRGGTALTAAASRLDSLRQPPDTTRQTRALTRARDVEEPKERDIAFAPPTAFVPAATTRCLPAGRARSRPAARASGPARAPDPPADPLDHCRPACAPPLESAGAGRPRPARAGRSNP